jgi:hypothetical protein
MGYQPVDRADSHLKLRYVHPETGDVRNVTIPMGKEISGDTLRNIADQCGASDYSEYCRQNLSLDIYQRTRRIPRGLTSGMKPTTHDTNH